jgi:hypothetical protein
MICKLYFGLIPQEYGIRVTEGGFALIKEKRSWSKSDRIPNLIGRKRVDWSIFDYGIHIPLVFVEDFEQANGDVHVNKGERYDIVLLVDGKEYSARINNFNQNDRGVDVLQIRYENNSELKELLINKFRTTYNFIKSKKEKDIDKTHIILPDEMAEYIDFYKTEKPFCYRIETISSPGLIKPLADILETREDEIWAGPIVNPSYSIRELSQDCGIEENELIRWVRAIERKGQMILYGPPGTGKTFMAELLSKHLIADNDGFKELLQFHPSYAYEDFVQGIRPIINKDNNIQYEMIDGRFVEFCKKAIDKNGCCVLIIDEINRANLSRVFGEIMYLLEYRCREIPLAGGGLFSIPKNVRIIGTMNTADRSVALVDHALRRRFSFISLFPNYEVLRKYHEENDIPIDGLINTLIKLNKVIANKHYEIGITFFLRNDLFSAIEDIWKMEIEPYLEEYFFDQPDRIDNFRWDKVKDKIIS